MKKKYFEVISIFSNTGDKKLPGAASRPVTVWNVAFNIYNDQTFFVNPWLNEGDIYFEFDK